MRNGRRLTRNEKRFLSKQGNNPKEYLLARADADSYTFYHVPTERILPPIRR